jgi:ADP-ribose pyrophosphatase
MQRTVPQDAVLIPDHAVKAFTGQVFDVYQWPQEMFDGSTATFEMLRRPDTVEFIAIRDGQLLFVEEEQPGKTRALRIPGGRVDPGEEWLAAVQRECQEELGLTFKNWRLVYVDQPVSKIEWFCAVFIATDFDSEQAIQHDAGERIQLTPHTFDAAKTAVMESRDYSRLAYLRPLFEHAKTLDDLITSPAFTGKTIER